MIKTVVFSLSCLFCVDLCLADLRRASWPRNTNPEHRFKIRHQSRRRQVKFEGQYTIYMEPSDFGYAGLKKQRDGGGYDNFLRSNIDNQQDRRDFKTEDGKDHLPFRSWEGFATDTHESQKYKIPDIFPGTNISVSPGKSVLVPLRWNNPHSAELEVNIWIMKTDKPYVVPILKPTCSGEGYQDQAFEFTVPEDFNQLGKKLPKFKGCKAVGDCVLQVYAHSVESRQYAIGTPLLVSGNVPTATATVESGVRKLTDISMQDPGLDLSTLRTLCRPRNDPAARNPKALDVVQQARLISDQYNHAYQNSDYSPYSGQQPKEISQNMQASCVVSMVPANRGTNGLHVLLKDNRQGFIFQRSLKRKAEKLVKEYEKIANSIILKIEDIEKMKNRDEIGPVLNHEQQLVTQNTSTCFRCKETGSTTTRRLQTATYIPSFDIEDPSILSAVKALAGEGYENVLTDIPCPQDSSQTCGRVQIYVPVMNDLMPEFEKAYALNVTYMGPMIKTTLSTLPDVMGYKKLDEKGEFDDGKYSARTAYAKHGYVVQGGPKAVSPLPSATQSATMAAALAVDCPYGGTCQMPVLASGVTNIADELDMHGVMADANCDDMIADVSEMECLPATTQLFENPVDEEAKMLGIDPNTQGAVVDGAFPTHVSLTAAWLTLLLTYLSLQ